MTVSTISEFSPHHHVIRGRRGDGVPVTAVVFRVAFPGATIDASEWTALAQLRNSPTDAAAVYTFTTVLQDNSDDATIETNELEVALQPIPGVDTAAFQYADLHGDLQLTQSGNEPITIVTLEVQLTQDVSR